MILDRLIEDAVGKIVAEEAPRIMKRELPRIIESHLRERFKTMPDAALTPVGFHWAFYIALKKHWPSVPVKTASSWLVEYLDAPVGTAGYEWTPRAAEELARSYVDEFGEAA